MPEDVHPGYVSGLNDPEVNRYLVNVKKQVQSDIGVREFVRRDLESEGALLLGIWLDGTDKHCGTIRLHGVEYENRTAHIGICIFDRQVWGRGVAKCSLRAVTMWAQDELRLRWIEAGIYDGNVGSELAFRSAGYEWIYDVPDKYLFEGAPIKVKVLAARSGLTRRGGGV